MIHEIREHAIKGSALDGGIELSEQEGPGKTELFLYVTAPARIGWMAKNLDDVDGTFSLDRSLMVMKETLQILIIAKAKLTEYIQHVEKLKTEQSEPAADAAAGKMAEHVEAPQPPAPQRKAETAEVPENVFLCHSKVVGTTFREKDKPIPWDELGKGKYLCLIREKDNQYDPNAIKVLYVPHFLGYLPKQTAAELAPKIDSGSHFFAEITEITGGVKDKENKGINIAIFEEV